MSEKFSLKWNDYQSNWNKALNELRKDTDLSDVTLISDDKVKFAAHKTLLSSCSNTFKFILKGNTHANTLLFLGGISSINLGFILDYIYYGEVNLFQEQLDSFLESAQKLEVEGLLSNNEDNLNEEKTFNQDESMPDETKYDLHIQNAGSHIKRQDPRTPPNDVKFNVESCLGMSIQHILT